MKLQKLTIHNLASIEDAVIDFDQPPLSDSEVFLITGKTGSGKTTILDAICLALFASTPRLDGTRMEGATVDGDRVVKIDDPRQLMRRDAGEAWVSLAYVGGNGVPYRAEWSVSRARRKPSGNLQPREWQLTNLDTGLTLTKQREVEAEVRASIGLDFKQFCRTTMLAQGEFTRFLNSRDEEKSAILEKITGVNIYSRIGAKVFELTRDKRQQWEESRSQAGAVRVLGDEELAARSEELARLDHGAADLLRRRAAADAGRRWLEEEQKLQRLASVAAQQWHEAAQRVGEEAFLRREAMVREWDETRDPRRWAAEREAAAQAAADCAMGQEQLRRQFADLLGGEAALKEARLQLAEQQKEASALVESEKDRSALYAEAQTVAGWLNAMAEGREAAGRIEKDLAALRDEAEKQLLPRYQSAAEASKSAAEAAEAAAEKARQQTRRMEELALPALRKKLMGTVDMLSLVKLAEERAEALLTERQKHLETGRRIEAAAAAIDRKKKQVEEFAPPIREAEVRRDTCRALYEKQRDSVDKFARAIRQRLRVGDLCPVCRQPILQPLPVEEELLRFVSGLHDEAEAAEKALDKLVADRNRLQAEVEADSAAYSRDLKAWQQDQSVPRAEQRAVEALGRCGIASGGYADNEALAQMKQQCVEAKAELEKQVAAAEQQEAAVKLQQRLLDKCRLRLDKERKAEQQALDNLNSTREQVKTAEALAAAKRHDAAAAEQQVLRFLPDSQAPDGWKHSPRPFAAALVKSAASYKSAADRVAELGARLQKADTFCQSLAAVLESLRQALPSGHTVAPSDARHTDALAEKANEALRQASSLAARRETAQKQMDGARRQVDDFLAQHPSLTAARLALLGAQSPEEIEAERKFLAEAHNRVLAKKTTSDDAALRLAQHRALKPQMAEGETIEALADQLAALDRRQREADERRGALRQELESDQKAKQRLKALLEEADRRKGEYDKWSRLNDLIGDASGKRFRTIAQSYVLANLIHSANHYMRSLSNRYTLAVEPGTFVIQLEDAYQGFARRAASTISGGESFLVSLSLALALSDIGQQLSVDTLFIDEGFGTLSGEPLQNAVNTLRSLRSKAGRHVGIISHVEELQERIPVQIRLHQPSQTSSSRIEIHPQQGTN